MMAVLHRAQALTACGRIRLRRLASMPSAANLCGMGDKWQSTIHVSLVHQTCVTGAPSTCGGMRLHIGLAQTHDTCHQGIASPLSL
jgi:hypothetical protein